MATDKGKTYSALERNLFDVTAKNINSREDLEKEAKKLAENMNRTISGVSKQFEIRLGIYWNERF